MRVLFRGLLKKVMNAVIRDLRLLPLCQVVGNTKLGLGILPHCLESNPTGGYLRSNLYADHLQYTRTWIPPPPPSPATRSPRMSPVNKVLLFSVEPGEVIGVIMWRHATASSKARLNHRSHTFAAKMHHNVDPGAEASENSSVPFSTKLTA
jgi:hypothetical protein